MFRLVLKIFIGSLTSIDDACGANQWTGFYMITASVMKELNYQKCTTQPTVINLHPNEYTQRLPCFPFAVNLDRCVGSCNTINDLSNKICIPNKTEDSHISVFNMITRINESKTLTKHILCKCKCIFDDRICNSN